MGLGGASYHDKVCLEFWATPWLAGLGCATMRHILQSKLWQNSLYYKVGKFFIRTVLRPTRTGKQMSPSGI